jgi:hypothetical protein
MIAARLCAESSLAARADREYTVDTMPVEVALQAPEPAHQLSGDFWLRSRQRLIVAQGVADC